MIIDQRVGIGPEPSLAGCARTALDAIYQTEPRLSELDLLPDADGNGYSGRFVMCLFAGDERMCQLLSSVAMHLIEPTQLKITTRRDFGVTSVSGHVYSPPPTSYRFEAHAGYENIANAPGSVLKQTTLELYRAAEVADTLSAQPAEIQQMTVSFKEGRPIARIRGVCHPEHYGQIESALPGLRQKPIGPRQKRFVTALGRTELRVLIAIQSEEPGDHPTLR